MRSFTRRAVTAGFAVTLVLLAAGPASAAGQPNEHATCLGEVFQAQAVSGPQTVSNRIHEIRELYLGDGQFGQALQPLAHDMCE